jgi:hypothetical protein
VAAHGVGHRPARDGRAMASQLAPLPLEAALEFRRCRSPAHRSRDPRAGSRNGIG